MKQHYHIKFCGCDDYKAFKDFLILHNLGFSHVITTKSSVGDTIFDILLDLTPTELMMIYLTINIIVCIPLMENLEYIA